VLRGGAGIYYTLPNTDQVNGFTSVAPFAPVFHSDWCELSRPMGSAGITNPFPRRLEAVRFPERTQPSRFPSVSPEFSCDYYSPDRGNRNMTLATATGYELVVQCGYVGNAGYHLSSNAVGRQH